MNWRNPKVLAPFLYLLTYRQQKLEKELIYETFWPRLDRGKAANTFSSLLY